MKFKLETIFRLLLPKYYNRITWSLIFVISAPLLSYPVWIDFVNVLLEKYEFPVIKMEQNIIVGVIVIICALLYNSFSQYIEYIRLRPNLPAFKNIQQENIVDFSSLCQAILPILKDNEYIFKHTGPNSNADESGELRMDLSLWEELKRDSILPNNAKISQILSRNIHLIPQSYRHLFEALELHIKAFERHVNKPNIDYTEYQFPKEITSIIERTCFSVAKKNKIFIKIHKWLSKRLNNENIKQSYIIGSFLMYPDQAKDLDIVICANNNFYELNLLSFDFKVKFKKTLHITYFEKEDKTYIDFCEKNKFKFKI